MADDGVIVDSGLDFAGAVAGTAAPPEVVEGLCLVAVRYCGCDDRRHEGQLVVQRDLAVEIREIFSQLDTLGFPLAGVIPIVRYRWSDEASMAADNTSAFNYRSIAGTNRLSLHAWGRAVDINPRRNPVFYRDGRIAPAGAVYRPGDPGVFADGDPAVRIFLERGWRWGGHFDHVRDHHHFEKPRE